MAVFLACYGVQPYLVSGSFFLPSYVSGPRRQWLGHFLRKGLMYVCHLLDALSPGGQACTSAWRDWISFPKCPPGCSVEFPRMGKFRVTHVTMVPREGGRLCVPSPCLFGLPVYVSSDNWIGVVFSRCPFILSDTCQTRQWMCIWFTFERNWQYKLATFHQKLLFWIQCRPSVWFK